MGQTFNFTTNQCEIAIRRGARSQPSDYESPPLTTRPGLQVALFAMQVSVTRHSIEV